MTANPPKISLLFTGDEFCSTIIVIASPPPMAFFGIRNRRLSPSAYRQNPRQKHYSNFSFSGQRHGLSATAERLCIRLRFSELFYDLAFAFSMLFSRIKNLLKIPHDLLFFFHRTVQLFFYFPYIGFSVHITHPLS